MTMFLIGAAITVVGLVTAGLLRIAVLAEQDAARRNDLQRRAQASQSQSPKLADDLFQDFSAEEGGDDAEIVFRPVPQASGESLSHGPSASPEVLREALHRSAISGVTMGRLLPGAGKLDHLRQLRRYVYSGSRTNVEYDLLRTPSGYFAIKLPSAGSGGPLILPDQFIEALRRAAEDVEPWATRPDVHFELQEELLEAFLGDDGQVTLRPSEEVAREA